VLGVIEQPRIESALRRDFQQGAKGYGQRFGAVAADGITDITIGGAILPSLLHQDPRYFYQGTGTTKSHLFHAISTHSFAGEITDRCSRITQASVPI
jgi:hypothetical protein